MGWRQREMAGRWRFSKPRSSRSSLAQTGAPAQESPLGGTLREERERTV